VPVAEDVDSADLGDLIPGRDQVRAYARGEREASVMEGGVANDPNTGEHDPDWWRDSIRTCCILLR
jgi:hypothetical protein